MNRLISIALLSFPISVFGQIQMDRMVVSSGGNSALINGIDISYTIGETVIQTLAIPQGTLTQGFHQPGSKSAIVFELNLSPASCITASDGKAEVVNISGCEAPYQITWSNGQVGEVAYDLSPGNYGVSVSTPNCMTHIDFSVEVQAVEICDLFFYNAFSPNGDGINEVWEIENIELPVYRENEVSIFNRWGQAIYQTQQYNNEDRSWKGDDKTGNKVASGTYFYIAKVQGREYTGYIELTR